MEDYCSTIDMHGEKRSSTQDSQRGNQIEGSEDRAWANSNFDRRDRGRSRGNRREWQRQIPKQKYESHKQEGGTRKNKKASQWKPVIDYLSQADLNPCVIFSFPRKNVRLL